MMNPLKNVVVIGDRILLKPLESSNKTGSGLYLPPSVKERDAVHTGLVVRVGPGYPIPVNYLHASGHEIEIDGEQYVIISQNAVLLVMRPEVPDDIDGILRD